MFEGCVALATAPDLQATTLSDRCYQYMFRYCTSLTTAPELPATTLDEQYCYNEMFNGCTSLNYIKCLATSRNVSKDVTYLWVQDVASTGTFVKAQSMTSWPSGNSGIPSGWTVQNV